MIKYVHEIRDPIHIFIKLDSDERKVIDSRPFQRLRYINQLAFTYLVYPGATHKRFEHSLGVMELATRIFNKLVNDPNVDPKITRLFPQKNKYDYYLRALRMASLCHDLGHLPFSHAAEKELFVERWNHERMTAEIIRSSEMEDIWRNMTPPLRSQDIVKFALGSKELNKFEETEFSPWETILSEIIVSDTFGADRIDYLLRDSYHAGVVYGKFGYYRLIDTLRILPFGGDEDKEADEPYIGIEGGGLNSAEALLLARYFMYSQLYLHSVRRIYDLHLKDFLIGLFPEKFPLEVDKYLSITDNEILVEIHKAAANNEDPNNKSASIISNRKHFKLLYERIPEDIEINLNPGKTIYEAACQKYGEENIKHDFEKSKPGIIDFPVIFDDDRIVSAYSCSQVLKNIPRPLIDNVFIAQEFVSEAKNWLDNNREKILNQN